MLRRYNDASIKRRTYIISYKGAINLDLSLYLTDIRSV